MSMSVINVGSRPVHWEGGWGDSHTIHFHGFESLSTERDKAVNSPTFSSFGHEWMVDLLPGGESDAPEDCVSLYLSTCSDKQISIHFEIAIKSGSGGDDVYACRTSAEFKGGEKWGWPVISVFAKES